MSESTRARSGRRFSLVSARQMAAAILGIGALIAPGRTLVLVLDRCSAYMLVVICKPLVGAGFVMDAFRPAAEADVAAPVNVSFVHTPAIVKGVMEAMAVYICDRGVVAEVVAMPLAAGVADAPVAVAVVHAAIVAAAYGRPFAFWDSSQEAYPGANLAIFTDKKAYQLLEAARQESDPTARQKDYWQFQNLISSDLPVVFLYSPYYTYPQDQSLKGFNISFIANYSDRFANLNEWYVKTQRVLK